MDAAIDTAAPCFFRSLIKTGIGPQDTEQSRGFGGESVVVAKSRCEHRRGCATEGGMAGDVFWKCWGNDKRCPGAVGHCVSATIGVRCSNGGHRSPEPIVKLGVPTQNCRVS